MNNRDPLSTEAAAASAEPTAQPATPVAAPEPTAEPVALDKVGGLSDSPEFLQLIERVYLGPSLEERVSALEATLEEMRGVMLHHGLRGPQQ